MSRLYLVFFFCCFSLSYFSQNNVKNYVKFADEQYKKGDYYYALEYYKMALEADSTNLDYLWKYAETLRAYKDYRQAEKFYLKVYQREKTKKYPYSLLYYGLMQKQNKSYQRALETFKLAQKKYDIDTESYLYKKSSREIESCTWAIQNIKDTLEISVFPLPSSVNSTNAEFPHVVKDGKLFFSSLRADSISKIEEVYSRDYKTKIYTSEIKTGHYQQNYLLDSLVTENKSRGNGTFSLDGKIYYFSLCEDESFNYRCQIWYSNYSNGKFSFARPLGTEINQIGSNTTMPSIGKINGKEVLFFSSDRNSNGMDLFFTYVNEGGLSFSNITPINQLNSIDNEITPWYDEKQNRLYFSSSWLNGFGGHDIFYSEITDSNFSTPINLGWPYNSPANDQYFFSYNDTNYLASNRIGSASIKNPTCCSDIFSSIPLPFDELIDTTIITTITTLKERLPVRLYFHNDQPNAWSWDTVTSLNYLETYNAYKNLVPRYRSEYSRGLDLTKVKEAEKTIEEFFDQKVDKGVEDLKNFTSMILEELDKGAKLKLTLKGFASPLAPTDYNVNLTKRRISSFVNYLRQYNKGVFIPYLDKKASNGGELALEFSPFGEYKADQTTSDNPKDLQKSVYSKAAAIERRIEIESISLMSFEDQFPIQAPKSVFNAGKIKKGQRVGSYFTIVNNSNKVVKINEILPSSSNVTFEIDNKTIEPNKSLLMKMFVKTNSFSGLSSESLQISIDGYTEKQMLTINFEAQ